MSIRVWSDSEAERKVESIEKLLASAKKVGPKCYPLFLSDVRRILER